MRRFLLVLSILITLNFFVTHQLIAEETKENKKGFLTVHSSPVGLDIYIDGKLVGKTPIEKLPLSTGSHKLSIATEPCFKQILFYTWNRTVNVFESDTTFLDLKPEPIMKEISIGELKVGENILEGNDIYVDRKKVGKVPGKIEIPICSKLLEVTEIDGNKVVYSSNIDLVKGEITKNEKRGYEISVSKDTPKTINPTSVTEFKPPESTKNSEQFKTINYKKKPRKKIIGPYKWVGASLIIGGALLAGTGGIFDYLAFKEFQDYERMGSEEEIREQLNSGNISKDDYLSKRDNHYKKGKNFVIARNIMFAAGGASALTGIILLFVKPSKKDKKIISSFQIVPGPNSFYISTDISF